MPISVATPVFTCVCEVKLPAVAGVSPLAACTKVSDAKKSAFAILLLLEAVFRFSNSASERKKRTIALALSPVLVNSQRRVRYISMPTVIGLASMVVVTVTLPKISVSVASKPSCMANCGNLLSKAARLLRSPPSITYT